MSFSADISQGFFLRLYLALRILCFLSLSLGALLPPAWLQQCRGVSLGYLCPQPTLQLCRDRPFSISGFTVSHWEHRGNKSSKHGEVSTRPTGWRPILCLLASEVPDGILAGSPHFYLLCRGHCCIQVESQGPHSLLSSFEFMFFSVS